MRQLIALALASITALPACGSTASMPEPLAFQDGASALAGVSEKMIVVEGGTFEMGGKLIKPDERPLHEVTVSSFALSETEVTQAEWMAVMPHNPSRIQDAVHPVENVTWFEVIEFLNALSTQHGLEPVYEIDEEQVVWDRSRNGYRLPTEAEWEYAARGGRLTKGHTFAGSDDMGEVAHYMGNNERDSTQPVATKTPNELGLFDMTGNVYEWTWDRKGRYARGAQVDPLGADAGRKRSVRGGSAYCGAPSLYLGWRNAYRPDTRKHFVGFRIARDVK